MMGSFCECCVEWRGGLLRNLRAMIYLCIIYILHLNLTAASIRSRANLFLVLYHMCFFCHFTGWIVTGTFIKCFSFLLFTLVFRASKRWLYLPPLHTHPHHLSLPQNPYYQTLGTLVGPEKKKRMDDHHPTIGEGLTG